LHFCALAGEVHQVVEGSQGREYFDEKFLKVLLQLLILFLRSVLEYYILLYEGGDQVLDEPLDEVVEMLEGGGQVWESFDHLGDDR
jgi:hypothetical protein